MPIPTKPLREMMREAMRLNALPYRDNDMPDDAFVELLAEAVMRTLAEYAPCFAKAGVMAYDPKLVEAVALAICEMDPQRLDSVDARWCEYTNDAEAALAAIDASGIAWVAPWEATSRMAGASWAGVPHASDMYTAMRDACISERRGAGAPGQWPRLAPG